MPEWASKYVNPVTIHAAEQRTSLGSWLSNYDGTGGASAAWPVANKALFIPFRLRDAFCVRQIVVSCGVTTGNNFDAGVYDRLGNLLVSSGSTARVSNDTVITNVTDTWLYNGWYYMALSCDSVSNMVAYVSSATAAVGLTKMTGMKEMASAFPLPSTATFATVAASYIPYMGLWRITT